MGVPAESLLHTNVELSVQKHLESAWSVPAGIPTAFVDADFDPDGLEGGSVVPAWASLTWLTGNAAAKGVSLLQIDMLSRRERDPVAIAVRRLRDSLKVAMRVRSIPMFDFSAVDVKADVEVPIPGNVVLVQSPDGHIGEASAIVGPTSDREFWRVSATFRLRLLTDASTADYYP